MTKLRRFRFLLILFGLAIVFILIRSDRPETMAISAPISPDTESPRLAAPSNPETRTTVSASLDDTVGRVAEKTEIVVVDAAGNRVSNARVGLFFSGSYRSLGRTQGSDSLRVPHETLSAGGLLTCAADGYANAEFELPLPAPRFVRLELPSEGRIRGRITMDGGRVPSAAISVICYPDRSILKSRTVFERLLAGDHSISFAHANPDGTFELVGLDARESYIVTAGGEGWVVSSPQQHIRPGGAELILEMEHLLAVTVVLRDLETRAPLELSASDWSAARVIRRCEDPNLRSYPSAESVSAYLAGVPFAADRPPRNRVTLVATSVSAIAAAGPLVLSVTLPGDEPVEARFIARSLDLGIQEEDLWLDSNRELRGRLRVEFVGGPAGGWSRTRQIPQPLRLRLASGADHPMEFSFDSVSDAPIELGSIPFGSYRVWFETSQSPFVFPPDRDGAVEIGPAGVPTLIVDLSGTGALDLAVSNKAGQSFDGIVQVEWSKVDPRTAGGFVSFSSPPYRLTCLEPGEYRIRFARPAELVPGQPNDGYLVSIAPGDVSRLEVSLADR